MRRWMAGPLLGITLMAAAPAQAALTSFSNPSAFAPGVSLVTFDGTGLGTSIAFRSLGGVGFALLLPGTLTDTGFGPTLASAPNSTIPRAFAPFDGPFYLNTISQDRPVDSHLRITLPSPVTAVAFELSGGGGFGTPDSLTFEAYAGASLVGTLAGGNSNPRSFLFYGIAASQAFDSVVIRLGPDARFGVENLRFGALAPPAAVPGPGALPLVALGLAALGLLRRRA